MTCKLTFLPVGNADSIVIQTEDSVVLVDLGKPRLLQKWLKQHQIMSIDRIYITHAHGDHFPSLTKLVEFLKIWIDQGTLTKFYLPYQAYQIAKHKLIGNRSSKEYQRLEESLNVLMEWDQDRTFIFCPITRGIEEYSAGSLRIEALHPSQLFVENHLASAGGKLNEISVVLKVAYGEFLALLLADIEGSGLSTLLTDVRRNGETYQLVKVPHHGAWPSNGQDLDQLFQSVDPELAVLSVGSTNSYGHVEADLFRSLQSLKDSKTQRLDSFICTEMTRTCTFSAQDRLAMGRKGLPQQRKCAGEITITADISGSWSSTSETNHSNIIAQLSHAACLGRADI